MIQSARRPRGCDGILTKVLFSVLDLPGCDCPGSQLAARIVVAAIRRSVGVHAEPHEKLVYILNKWLQRKPEEIESDFRDGGLRNMSGETVRLFKGLKIVGLSTAGWDAIFKPLDDQIQTNHLEERKLSSYAGKLTLWVQSIDRRFVGGILDAEITFSRLPRSHSTA